MTAPYVDKVEVSSDGQTVWVNNAFVNIGRFGRLGIDVHNADATSCLHCTHGITTVEDWETFKLKMLEHHGVVVTDEHKPKRFLEAT